MRLRYFLETAGYNNQLLSRLKKSFPAQYKLGEIVVFAMVSIETLTVELGYDDHGVLRLLHGGSSTSEEKEQKINNLYVLHETKVKEGRARLMELVGKKGQTPEPVTRTVEQPSQNRPQTSDRETTQIEKDLVIESVGHGLLCLLPLLERVVGDDFSSEDRKYLRKIVGYEVTPRIADAIRKLTSETARKQLSGNGGNHEGK